jgi:protein required for attachment to host cells
MAKHRSTWIVIADGGRASILKRRDLESGFDVIARLDSPDAHMASHDLMSERPGRTRESANSAHHAIEPRTDPHTQRKLAFIDSVAAHLNQSDLGNSFDRLILVAPAHALGELRERLAPHIAAKVVAMLTKDLTKLPLDELDEHLAAIL